MYYVKYSITTHDWVSFEKYSPKVSNTFFPSIRKYTYLENNHTQCLQKHLSLFNIQLLCGSCIFISPKGPVMHNCNTVPWNNCSWNEVGQANILHCNFLKKVSWNVSYQSGWRSLKWQSMEHVNYRAVCTSHKKVKHRVCEK